jgi:small ubiquitin-related modifier
MVYFKMMKKKTALKKLMEAYCASESLQMDQVRFLFSGNRVRENQTPEELEMEDGDVIDAMKSAIINKANS